MLTTNKQTEEAERYYPNSFLIEYYEKCLDGLQQRVEATKKRLEELYEGSV